MKQSAFLLQKFQKEERKMRFRNDIHKRRFEKKITKWTGMLLRESGRHRNRGRQKTD
jgi:hypothetical protein